MTTAKRSLRAIAALLALGLGGGVLAAAAPKALEGVSGGLWELAGVPGHKAPVQRCIADPTALMTLEHSGAKCSQTVLGEQGATVRLSSQCGAAGFGQGTIKQLTPRTLRVEATGIANGAPFTYVVQARRLGDCPKGPERGR